MKKIILSLFTIIIWNISFAQDVPLFDLGLKAGLNASSISDLDDKDGQKIGLVAGAWARVKLPLIGLYVQPEMVISQTGGKTKFEETTSFFGIETTTEVTSKITLTNLDIPILLGQRFGVGPLGIRVNLGPNFSTVLSAKSKGEAKITVGGVTNSTEDEEDIKDNINTFQVGLQAGVGVDISKLSVDLRYQHNFTKLVEDAADDDKSRINAIQLTVGFKLL